MKNFRCRWLMFEEREKCQCDRTQSAELYCVIFSRGNLPVVAPLDALS
ncbi:hypothetical protein [Kamptonema sp. UHCC 0994]|nr:hypothetical protein [Kamptonema sp. UHCC 0994]MDF0553834.1 hypothetical protein [Kamptonema sp. UHCC 0994]